MFSKIYVFAYQTLTTSLFFDAGVLTIFMKNSENQKNIRKDKRA